MIESITIKNFAVIKDISFNFSKGLNIFTGETGAGKSIIVESLSFLFGSKYYSNEIKESVSVSAKIKLDKKTASFLNLPAVFEIKRVYSPDRKSRYYIDTNPVNLAYVSNISGYIIDFHAQMANESIIFSDRQTEILDSYAGLEDEVEEFSKLYDAKSDLESKINAISLNEDEKKKLTELYEYQIKEIESANLKKNEDAELEEIISRAKNTAKIKNLSSDIISKINDEGGIYDMISKIVKRSEDLSSMDESFGFIYENSLKIESDVKKLSEDISALFSKYQITEEELDEYVKRDELIKSLKKKYGTDLNGVISKKEELKKKIEEIGLSNDNIEKLKKDLSAVEEKMIKLAGTISQKRKIVSKKLSEDIKKELKKLGFEHCLFDISVEDSEVFNKYGKNTVEFLFSSNPDYPLKPIRYVASGGEISRIMLALKSVLSNDAESKTFIFDEIDSGIGGNTAFFVGEAMRNLAKSNQILSVTHMPQVAVFADSHFKVEKNYKDKITLISVKELKTSEDRIEEISRMLGSVYSPLTAQKHAKELIKKALSRD
ncbi:MAG: DNA repair protein RecN [Elusimicrobiales bacterium]